jgi:hypothetical protein
MGHPLAVDAPKLRRPSLYWKTIFRSATHCGSACVIDDIIGAPIVLVTGFLSGARLYAEYAVEFLLAYLFGIAFQYFPIRAMCGVPDARRRASGSFAPPQPFPAHHGGCSFGW